MTLTLTKEERSQLLGGPLAAALAVMTVDFGLFSSAREVLALGKDLATAASRYADNPLITSLFDPESLKDVSQPQALTITPDDVKNGKVLDRALEQVDQAMAVARAKCDAPVAREFAQCIVDGCVAVAEAAGKGLFGSGEKVSPEEEAALERIRQHLGLTP